MGEGLGVRGEGLKAKSQKPKTGEGLGVRREGLGHTYLAVLAFVDLVSMSHTQDNYVVAPQIKDNPVISDAKSVCAQPGIGQFDRML